MQRKAMALRKVRGKTRLDYNAHKVAGVSAYVLLLFIYLGR